MDTPFRFFIEAVEGIDKTNRSAAVTHDDGHRPGTAAKVLNAAHHGRIGNGCRRENAVIPFYQIIEGHDLVNIFDAHIQTALPFFVGIRNESGLHIAAEALQGGRCQNPFRCTADSHDDVDAGTFDTGVDRR